MRLILLFVLLAGMSSANAASWRGGDGSFYPDPVSACNSRAPAGMTVYRIRGPYNGGSLCVGSAVYPMCQYSCDFTDGSTQNNGHSAAFLMSEDYCPAGQHVDEFGLCQPDDSPQCEAGKIITGGFELFGATVIDGCETAFCAIEIGGNSGVVCELTGRPFVEGQGPAPEPQYPPGQCEINYMGSCVVRDPGEQCPDGWAQGQLMEVDICVPPYGGDPGGEDPGGGDPGGEDPGGGDPGGEDPGGGDPGGEDPENPPGGGGGGGSIDLGKLVEEVSDNRAQEMRDGWDTEASEAVETVGNEIIESMGESVEIGDPNVFLTTVLRFFPQSSGCSDVSYDFGQTTVTLSCSDFAPLRQGLGWLFAAYTVFTLVSIALRKPAGV